MDVCTYERRRSGKRCILVQSNTLSFNFGSDRDYEEKGYTDNG